MSLVPRVGRADMDAVQTWVVCGKTEGWVGEGIWKEEFWWEGA